MCPIAKYSINKKDNKGTLKNIQLVKGKEGEDKIKQFVFPPPHNQTKKWWKWLSNISITTTR